MMTTNCPNRPSINTGTNIHCVDFQQKLLFVLLNDRIYYLLNIDII